LGLPLASDFAKGVPASHHGNYSIYTLADQMIWQHSAASKRYLTAFVRPSCSVCCSTPGCSET